MSLSQKTQYSMSTVAFITMSFGIASCEGHCSLDLGDGFHSTDVDENQISPAEVHSTSCTGFMNTETTPHFS